MDQFIEYVEAASPGYTRRFRGSNADDIEEYLGLLRVQPPHVYRSFLTTLGDSDGGLQIFEDAKTSATDLVAFYRDSVLTGECRFPKGAFPVAIRGWSLNEACMLPGGDEDGHIVANRDEEIIFDISTTLLSLLYKKTFVALYMNSMPVSGMYIAQGTTSRIESVRLLLLSCDFQIEWYSDSIGVAARSKNLLVFARQFAGHPCWVRISGPTKGIVADMANRLCTPFQIAFERWWSA